MRALLDVNVLIALFDADHLNHAVARSWMLSNAEQGWASCPLTQNGCVRVMSQRRYPSGFDSVAAAAQRLREAVGSPAHEFWPDGVSLLDTGLIDPTRIHGTRQITDCYLLGLAVARGGRFVTFEQRVSLSAVAGARSEHLLVV